MISLDTPLDETAAGAAEFLDAVQGNLLKGHGRDHTAHLFFRFEGDPGAARTWLSSIAETVLTSATDQFAQTERFHLTEGAGEPFAFVALSAAGYEALAVAADLRPADPFFAAGMKRHNEVGLDPINDPSPADWESGFRDDIHGMLLLADDDPGRLNGLVAQHSSDLAGIGARLFVERGNKLLFDFGGARGVLEIEQFGHQDGISNPRLTLKEIDQEKAERGSAHWDPSAPLRLVFAEEPGVPDRYGSYFVFRKLEQDVRRYQQKVGELADLAGVSRDHASALIVGRHRDGTPLMPFTQPQPGGSRVDPNDFNFATDRPTDGSPASTCPFHAHIRRSNPRGELPIFIPPSSVEFERSMRIARRGITYGKRPDLETGEEPPATGIGLLFMSAQGSLRQFSIQQSGSDSADFPFAAAGMEGLTGRSQAGSAVEPQQWPVGSEHQPLALFGFVNMLGGEYFFAPSLPFLRELATA